MSEETQVAGDDQQVVKDDKKPGEDQQGSDLAQKLEEVQTQLNEMSDDKLKTQQYITKLQQQIADQKPQEQEDEETKNTRRWLEQNGYLPKTEVDKMLDQKLSERESLRQIAESEKSLKSKYNGKDEYKDYPQFDMNEVGKYAQENQIFNLEQAYRSLHNDKIMAIEVNKAIEASKKTSAVPDRSDAPSTETVDKETIQKKVTADVASDPTKLAAVLREIGMGSAPVPK